jgi:hypothetical protein
MEHTKSTLHDSRYLIPIRYFIVKNIGARHFCGRTFSWANITGRTKKYALTQLPLLTCHTTSVLRYVGLYAEDFSSFLKLLLARLLTFSCPR